ncbi:hypothetical protein BKH46_08420 [Helicobacter sp. 12S02634-8]|uniref:hypothetical protein n=1 Tax=Helicobacter sp. 12S02634-8 TaxID=1476199 RepID=UPI000BA51F8A|nr:hypothetical protein [Helicobacter sp. 12S02634-8]PAF46254.1 hypothetical protein BKH46_08420 [Helicobacter sp. 12S02634-8]
MAKKKEENENIVDERNDRNERWERNLRNAERRLREIVGYLDQKRRNGESVINGEKMSFINRCHLIFRNKDQINNVNIVIGDDFAREVSRELSNILRLESEVRQRINARAKAKDLEEAIAQIEKFDGIKKKLLTELKNMRGVLEKDTSNRIVGEESIGAEDSIQDS